MLAIRPKCHLGRSVGKQRGLVAGSHPATGRWCADSSRERFRRQQTSSHHIEPGLCFFGPRGVVFDTHLNGHLGTAGTTGTTGTPGTPGIRIRYQVGFYLRAPPSLPLPLCALPLPLVLALRPLPTRCDALRWLPSLCLSTHLPRSLHHACALAGLDTAVSPAQACRYRCERTKRRRERGVSQSIDESRVSRMLDGYALSSPSRSICCPPLSALSLLYSILLFLSRSLSLRPSLCLSVFRSLALALYLPSLSHSRSLLLHPPRSPMLPSFLRVYAAMYVCARVAFSDR